MSSDFKDFFKFEHKPENALTAIRLKTFEDFCEF